MFGNTKLYFIKLETGEYPRTFDKT